MKLHKAIEEARKQKCQIKNEHLRIPMSNMGAKDLMMWLINDPETNVQRINKLCEWLDSDGWELDYEAK